MPRVGGRRRRCRVGGEGALAGWRAGRSCVGWAGRGRRGCRPRARDDCRGSAPPEGGRPAASGGCRRRSCPGRVCPMMGGWEGGAPAGLRAAVRRMQGRRAEDTLQTDAAGTATFFACPPRRAWRRWMRRHSVPLRAPWRYRPPRGPPPLRVDGRGGAAATRAPVPARRRRWSAWRWRRGGHGWGGHHGSAVAATRATHRGLRHAARFRPAMVVPPGSARQPAGARRSCHALPLPNLGRDSVLPSGCSHADPSVACALLGAHKYVAVGWQISTDGDWGSASTHTRWIKKNKGRTRKVVRDRTTLTGTTHTHG